MYDYWKDYRYKLLIDCASLCTYIRRKYPEGAYSAVLVILPF